MSRQYAGYRIAQWLSIGLPASVTFRLAEALADVQWRRAAMDRIAVQTNLSMMVGTPIDEFSPRVREVFRHFGRYIVEFFSIHRVLHPGLRIEGYQHLEDIRHRGSGAILLTAHLGNWEAGAILIRRMGFPVAAVALPHDDPKMDRLFNDQRQRCGIEVIPLGRHAARRSLRALRQGWLLGLLGDREFSDQGLRMPLCGREVILPRGPAVLSLRARVPVIPAFLVREGSWAFRLHLDVPIWPTTEETDDMAVAALTRRYAAVLERYLKLFPEQWLMFQPVAAK